MKASTTNVRARVLLSGVALAPTHDDPNLMQPRNPLRRILACLATPLAGLGLGILQLVPSAQALPPVTDGLTVWLDASQLTGLNDGDTVNTWTDMSGLANDATRSAGAPTYKTGVLNGQPVIRFTRSAGDAFTTADLSSQLPSAATVFIVTTINNAAAYTLVCTNAGNPRDEWWRWDGDGKSYPAAFRSPRVEGYCDMPSSGSHLFAISSSAGTWQMWTDGTSPGAAGGAYNAGGAHVIGSGSSGGTLNGDIAEILIYTRALTPTELNTVGVYLTAKYGLTANYFGPASIMSFGPGAVIDQDLKTIAWTVPYGTNLAALTPTITTSSGDCVPASGESPVLDGSNQATYTVTDTATSTENVYTLTVTVAPDETTLIWSVGSGAWDLAAPNWNGQSSGVLMPFFNGANVIFDKTAGGTITIASDMSPLSTTVSAGNYTFSGGPIAGTGSLTKDGGGTLKVDGLTPNTYSGGTLINGGTLHCGTMVGGISPGLSGVLGTGPVTLGLGTTIEFDNVTTANALISNGGKFASVNGWGTTWNGPVTLNANTTVDTTNGNAGNVTFGGAVSGDGGLIITSRPNGPTVVLSVSNSYTGPTEVTGGTLECKVPDALGSGALSISAGAKVNLNYTGTQTIASLTLGGVAKLSSGTYGSGTSGADFPDDTYFAGGGTVLVGDPGPKAYITSFGSNAVIGEPVGGAANITWIVPFGTVLAGLAPSFTMSSGAICDQTSGNIPTPDFRAGSVDYTVVSSDTLITNVYTVTVTELPAPPGGTSASPVCWYDAGNGVAAPGGAVSAWADQSGWGHHGTTASGTPVLAASQLNSLPAVQFRGNDDWLNLAGTFFAKEQYIVMSAPAETWSNYGGFLGRGAGRASNYLTENGTTEFHGNQYPGSVSRNGTALSSPFSLAPITEYMLVKFTVNNGDTSAASYQIGRADGYTCDWNVAEIIGYDHILSVTDENLVGDYIATKYGLEINEVLPPPPFTMALTGNSTTGTLMENGEADGYRFDTGGSALTVNWLGLYDAPNDNVTGTVGDGLLASHRVSIWRESDGVLVAQTTVLTTDALEGNFRGRNVTPVTLTANTGYVIAADYGGTGDRQWEGANMAEWGVYSGISNLEGRYGGPGGGMPTGGWGVMVGPNFGNTGAVGGTYTTWASANGIPGEPASGDFDNDGLTNLMEYALGMDPKVSSQPAGTLLNGVITFTKGADAIANGDVSWVIEESSDLGLADPWTPAVTQPAGDPALTISYTLPVGAGKVFARLKVTVN